MLSQLLQSRGLPRIHANVTISPHHKPVSNAFTAMTSLQSRGLPRIHANVTISPHHKPISNAFTAMTLSQLNTILSQAS